MLTALVLGILLGFLGSIPIAGPVAVLVVQRGLDNRLRAGFQIAVGAAIAESIYCFMAFWGLTAILERYPVIVPASRAVGIVLLAALGVYFLTRPPPADPSAVPVRQEEHGAKIFFGFTITILNPTLMATWSAVVTAVHSADLLNHNPANAFAFAPGAGVGIVLWFGLLLRLLDRFRKKLRPSSLQTVLRATGGLLVVLAMAAGVRMLVQHP